MNVDDMLVYKDGVIGVIKFNRLTLRGSPGIKTLQEIEKTLDQWKSHKGIKVVVLTGEGESAFDYQCVPDKTPSDSFTMYLSDISKKIKRYHKVTIAVMNNHVSAEEWALAMGSDIRIAVEKIQLANTTGDIMTAEEAKERGLVSIVVPREELWQTVIGKVSQLLDNESDFSQMFV